MATPYLADDTTTLDAYLESRGYDAWGRHFIQVSLRQHGELATAVAERLLHPAHEAMAMQIVENSLADIPFDSLSWDMDQSTWADLERASQHTAKAYSAPATAAEWVAYLDEIAPKVQQREFVTA